MVILPRRPDRARAFPSRAIVLRGNKVIFNNVRFRHPDAWKGLFSQCSFSGHIVSFVRTYLGLLNIPDTVFVPFVISRGRCWFQDFIEPFVHYIPIAYDLSNLEEMITWVREHDDEARDIARRALALSTEIFSSTFQKQYLMRSIHSHVWSPRLY